MKPSRSNAGRRAAVAAAAAILAIPMMIPSAALGATGHAREVSAKAAGSAHRAKGRSGRSRHSRSSGSVPPVTISPLPGTPDASPHTQISFLGVPADEIHKVSVVGSRSGGHPGRLEAYASAEGASFLPDKGFVQGEHVTVTAVVGPPDAQRHVSSAFNVARFFHYKFPGRTAHTAATSGPDVQSLPSDPELHPTTLSVTVDSPQASQDDVFFGFNGGAAQWGPMIINSQGQLVWFHPLSGDNHAMDFKVAEYGGEPVLVWWQGYIPPLGVGFGRDEIYNSHYEQVAEVKAGNGYQADLHEVLITPQGQAYTTAVTLVQANTTSKGGFPNGGLVDSVVQEIDIKTGLVMWEWHAFGHVPLNESFTKPPAHAPGWPFDFFHANSISLSPRGNGNLLVSSRNTWTGYAIDHRTGQILWRLGGKHSSFKMGPHTQTAYQHDMKWQPDGTITIFDNGGSPAVHPQSRVLHERINWKTHEVELLNDNFHSPNLAAASQGDDQLLANGDSFVGWGAQPYFTEFSPTGQVLFDAHLPAPGESYRAYRFPWTGTPSSPPSVVVRRAGHGNDSVYVSWNGATNVASWRVLSGAHEHLVAQRDTTPKTSFETQITVHSRAKWFAVQALGSSGETLATSPEVNPEG